MGVKLQFVLGVILVSLVRGSKNTPNIVPTNPTTSENVALDKPDHHINLIEKSPKTETEQKNVNSNNTHNNLTNVKLNQTDPHMAISARDENDNNDNKGVESFSNNVVERGRVDEPKKNAINADPADKNRDDKSISRDAPHSQKYASSDYHRKNNVYTSPLSIDPEKYIDEIFNVKTTTDKFENDFDDLELTTPKSYYFDNKYRTTVDNIDQKLEDEDDNDADSEEEPQMEMQNENTTPNSNFMEFKELQGMKNKTFKDKNKVHKDTIVMQVKRVNINTSFFNSEIDEDEDDEDNDEKFLKGEMDKLETTSPKNNFILTTRKSVILTKPPTNKNNSHILSNNIETDTIKSINFITSEPPTTKATWEYEDRSSHPNEVNATNEKIHENQIIPLQTSTSTIRSTKVLTTTIEHNLVPAIGLEDEETTTYSEESFTSTTQTFEDSRTIRIEENFTPTLTSEEDVQENSSSELREDEDTTNVKQLTTNMIETTMIHTVDVTTPKVPETTTGFSRKTESLIEEILTVNDEPTTIKDKITTSQELTRDDDEDENVTVDTERTFLLTTPIDREEKIERSFETTTLTRDNEETSEAEIHTETSILTTTMLNDEDSTIEAKAKTVEPGFRTSKSMNSAKDSETINTVGSTKYSNIYQNSFPSVTEIIRRSTTTESGSDTTPSGSITTDRPTDLVDESTSINPEVLGTILPDFSQIENITTTQKPTTYASTIVESTGEVFTTFAVRETAPEITEKVTSPSPTITMLTKISTMEGSDDLTTVPTETSSEKTTDVPENYPSTTTLKTTTTTLSFIRIANVDGDHTTILPEKSSPGVTDLPTSPEITTENFKPSEESIVITTTEDGTDTAATEGVTGTPDDKKGTIAAIVISTVGAVCLVLLAGLLYIMRKRQKRFNYGERCRPVSLDDYSVDNVSVYNSVRRKTNFRQSKRSYGNPAFDDPAAVSHPLNFPALGKFASNAEDMKAEFEEIPQIAARTSELPDGCETKNRYANVIPLPETRVCLKPIEGCPNSDYINANYVTGPKNVKGYYIATQAPMQNTVDDFWRMIWEEQSKVILMITHFFENGVEKCVDYLPPSEVLDCHRLFGDFQVTLKKRDVKDKYIISSLQLKNMVSNSWREITHFWYMGWPEKGVPTEGNSLIAFLIEARSYMKGSTLDKNAVVNGDMQNGAHTEINPVVVHCSPGTGRTGVVIACDIAIREFEQTRLVDIPKIVYRLRRDRANAVQTREQYMFIYKVVSLYATKVTGGSLDSL